MATLRVGVPDAATPGRGPHSRGEVDYFGGHSTRIDYISGSTTQAMDLSNNLDVSSLTVPIPIPCSRTDNTGYRETDGT
jgi:hypothetical protein